MSSVTNYGELKAQILDYLHRPDLPDEVDDFIDNARQRINQRFNRADVAFVADADTNDVLTKHPQLYLYAALVDGHGWLHNGDAMTSYNQMFIGEVDTLLITNPDSVVDVYDDTTGPPQISNWEAP